MAGVKVFSENKEWIKRKRWDIGGDYLDFRMDRSAKLKREAGMTTLSLENASEVSRSM